MSRFAWLTSLSLLLTTALAALWGSSFAWPWWLLTVLLLYAGLVSWGVCDLSKDLFIKARCRAKPATDGHGRVALTFDDGPLPEHTDAILDLLAAHEVPAAFFCIGARAQASPALMRRIVDDGHLVANHSFAHSPWLNFSLTAAYQDELQRAQDAIYTCAQKRPRFFRPPVGLSNPHMARAVQNLGLEVIGWSIRSLDTWGQDPTKTLARIEGQLHDGAIILLHDHAPHAPALLEALLDLLETHQLQPVRLDTLLASHPYLHEMP